MLLKDPGAALTMAEVPSMDLGPRQVRVVVSACGVCRTDLHVVDSELPNPKIPLVPGHEIVGRIIVAASDVERVKIGDRVGIPWLGWTCGRCEYCRQGRENLCPNARFTGYTLDGGFAQEAIADAAYVVPLPNSYSDEAVAPLLCAGLIGWRALRPPGLRSDWAFTASAPPHTSLRRWHTIETKRFTRLCVQAIRPPNALHMRWVLGGQVHLMALRRSSSTRRSFSHPWAILFRRRCERFDREVSWCAVAST